jgi:hypothetical protein
MDRTDARTRRRRRPDLTRWHSAEHDGERAQCVPPQARTHARLAIGRGHYHCGPDLLAARGPRSASAVPCKVVGFDCGKDSWIQRRVDSEPALEDGFIDRAVAGQLLKKFNY